MNRVSSYQMAKSMPLTTSSNARWAERCFLRLGLALVDTIAIWAGFWLAYYLRFETNVTYFYQPEETALPFYTTLVFWLIPLWLIVFSLSNLYNFELLFGGTLEYAKVFNACTVSMMLVIVASFLDPELIIARAWLLLSWGIIMLAVLVGRFAIRRVVYRLRERGHFLTSVLIVGANDEGTVVAEQLQAAGTSGVWLAGFVDDDQPIGTKVACDLPVLGNISKLSDIIKSHGIQEVIIASSAVSREKMLDIYRVFGSSDDVKLRLSSGLFEIITTGVQVREVGSVPLLHLRKMRLADIEIVLKMLLDYSISLAILPILVPTVFILGLLIKLDSPGPIFHRRRVLGVGGKQFDAFKFRTMYTNADEILEQDEALNEQFQVGFKLKDDPRVTRIGRLLRSTSLDELPQLINVLRGEMSLIGPRMITAEEHDRYGKWKMNLLTVKPGISGLWQVSGRSELSYDERVMLDMRYVRDYTIWLDLQILFQTLPKVIRRDGAY